MSTIGVDTEIVNGNDLKIEVNGKSSQVTIPSSGGKWVQLDKSNLPTFNVGDIVLIETNVFSDFAGVWTYDDTYTVSLIAVLQDSNVAKHQPIHTIVSNSTIGFTTAEVLSVSSINSTQNLLTVRGGYITPNRFEINSELTIKATDKKIVAIYRFE